MAEAWSPFGAFAGRLPFEGQGARLAAAGPMRAAILEHAPEAGGWEATLVQAAGMAEAPALGRSVIAGATRLARLGPDRWFSLNPDEAALPRLLALRERFPEAGVFDVSEARAWLALEGPAAERALQGLCERDLGETAFGAGAFGLVRVGPAVVMLARMGGDAFLVGPQTSLAEHYAALLIDAASRA